MVLLFFNKNISETEKLREYKIKYRKYPENTSQCVPFYIKKFSGHFRRPSTI